MRKFICLLAAATLALIAVAPQLSAQEPLTDEEAFAVVAHSLFGAGVDPYEEVSQTDGTPLESGFAKLNGVIHGLWDAPPSEVYPLLRRALGVEVLSEGDETFDNTVGQTHFWGLRFALPLPETAVGELGIAFVDQGAPQLSHNTLATAATTGTSRQVAVVFGPQNGTVYAVTNASLQPDLFTNPFFVGASVLPTGEWLVIFAGPFSPEWKAYFSGTTTSPADPGFLESLAGAATPLMQPALAQTPRDTVAQEIADNPEIATLATFLQTGESGETPDQEDTDDPLQADNETATTPGTEDNDQTTTETSDDVADTSQTDETAAADTGPAEIAIDVNDPEGDPGDGFAWVPVIIATATVGGITFFYFMWVRKRDSETNPEPSSTTRTIFDPATTSDPDAARDYVDRVTRNALDRGADKVGDWVDVSTHDFFADDVSHTRVPNDLDSTVVHREPALGKWDDDVIVHAIAGRLAGVSLPRPADLGDDRRLEANTKTGVVRMRTFHERPAEPVSMSENVTLS